MTEFLRRCAHLDSFDLLFGLILAHSLLMFHLISMFATYLDKQIFTRDALFSECSHLALVWNVHVLEKRLMIVS